MKGLIFLLLECDFADFIGKIDKMLRRELFQLGTGTKAPRHSASRHSGIGCCLHIHS